ncbi:MAG: acyltransferase [Acidobacteriota bacterium]
MKRFFGWWAYQLLRLRAVFFKAQGWLYTLALTSRFERCGRGVRINGPCTVVAPEKVRFGDNVHLGAGAYLYARGGLSIGDNTHISRNLVVYTANHDFRGERLPYDDHLISKPVHIGRNVWLGMNVAVVPGVTIGDGAIIGMGTTVSRDVEPLAIVGGAGQRVLGRRDEEGYRQQVEEQAFGGPSGRPLPDSLRLAISSELPSELRQPGEESSSSRAEPGTPR